MTVKLMTGENLKSPPHPPASPDLIHANPEVGCCFSAEPKALPLA
uniref:Uncharacterized protein n=1 Tax=Arundo donax TaxID=35708 RepID=A0A0A9FIC8_ARUDO